MTILKFGIDLLNEGQTFAAADANLLWQILAAFTPQPNVLDIDLTAPPGSETTGDIYVPAATATGAWTGQEGNFAVFLNSSYYFVSPAEGMTRWVADTNTHQVYDGSTWNTV